MNTKIQNKIQKQIKFNQTFGENTAVYLSGGMDSAIILYHVTEAARDVGKKIFTYTADFGIEKDECMQAERIANYFGSIHKNVKIDGFYNKLQEILPLFEKPRFNVWPYFLAEAAKRDACKNIYIGEGSDEIFGGYDNKSYLQAWADSIIYIMPTFKIIHKYLNLELKAPFYDLDWRYFLGYHLNPNKKFLREAYRSFIPDFILDAKSRPPAITNYIEFGKKEFPQYFHKIPESQDEARKRINKIVTYLWLQYQ